MAFDPASLCIECAKHPSLKRFIELRGRTGFRCAICEQLGAVASQPEDVRDLAMIIRGLVRFYYSEWEYNGHWGASETEDSLLLKENPILVHQPKPGGKIEPENVEAFLKESIFWPPYPESNEGIAIYSGFFDNGDRRPPLSALSSSVSPLLRNIEKRLLAENYFEVEEIMVRHLEDMGGAIETHIDAGSLFYRARIGTAGKYQKFPLWDFTPTMRHRPFQGQHVGAPPPPVASAGRANRAGVSFLYLASDEATAAAEVRPHPAHLLSIACFEVNRVLKIADFGRVNIGDFTNSEKRLALYHLAYSIDLTMSMPIVPEDRERYTATQLVADLVRRRGFDGIKYRSSVGSGINLCVFVVNALREYSGLGKVMRVRNVSYNLETLDTVLEPGEEDIEIS